MTKHASNDTGSRQTPHFSKSIRLRALARKIRNAWAIVGISLALLVLIEGVCRVAGSIRDSGSDSDSRAFADAYEGADWTQEYFREFQESNVVEWHPYVYWRRQPHQGQWVNIDDQRLRKTWSAPGERPLRIFFFGGSTMWGTGARDDFTIASLVAKRLAETGVYADVSNFGELGYVSQQELIALLSELQKGNIPDLVVCYDGVNDTFSAFQNRTAGLAQGEFNRSREFNTRNTKPTSQEAARYFFPGFLRVANAIKRRIMGESTSETWVGELSWNGRQENHDDRLAEAVVDHYRSVIETVEVVSEAHGFRVLFYWQPTVFQKQHRSPDELGYSEGSKTFFTTVYDRVGSDRALARNSNFRNLSDIFANEPRPLFIDFCHMAETGNDLIAQRMVTDIRSALNEQQ